MPSFFDLQKYAATGIAAPDMSAYDKARALAAFGGGAVQTLTDAPPLSFKANGKPLLSWSMSGNGQQTGTPTPDAPIQPTFCGVRTNNRFDYKSVYAAYIDDNGNVATTANLISAWNKFPAELIGKTVTISFYAASVGLNTVFVQSRIGGQSQRGTGVNAGDTGYCQITVTPESADDEWRVSYSTGVIPVVLNQFVVAESETRVDYEPYGYKIPITCAGQTAPVYLGQTQTVRRIGKIIFDGTEAWGASSNNVYYMQAYIPNGYHGYVENGGIICTHYAQSQTPNAQMPDDTIKITGSSGDQYTTSRIFLRDTSFSSAAEVQAYMAAQYANGTPVIAWYPLAEPETGIINEPLCKIGDCADELHSSDTTVSIPTVKGQNTLTVEGDLPPSEMTITYKG